MSLNDNPFYGQIMFFEKNKIDLDNPNVGITITDAVATYTGQDYTNFMRNRNNFTAWMTTGSTDAAGTEMLIDLVDERFVSDIILIGHNLKAFTIQYWTGLVYTDFPTPISETTNTDDVNYFTNTGVNTSKIKITITGTQVADADKFIKQLIFTEKLGAGQLEAWPEIKSPRHNPNRKTSRMLSGKVHVVETLGAFSCSLKIKTWRLFNDLDIIERLYFGREPALMWLGGNNETQFSYAARGYRKEDLYLVRPVNDWKPEFYKACYSNGIKLNIKLEEAVS
ncbi:hypothetical protein KAU11_07435 [Candidatus Babeliales bacterium]|nr:hypothetical protein [Candidatus Babeliales bacterium]